MNTKTSNSSMRFFRYIFFLLPIAPAAPAPVPAQKAVSPQFAPYMMMRKLLPEPALRHKMTADGFSDGDIDGFFAATADAVGGGGGGGASAPPPSAPAKAAPAAPAATKADAPPPAPSKLPQKASGARGNLLAAINAKRIE